MFWDAAHNDNSGGGLVSTTGPPAARTLEDWQACQAYIAKYQAKFGVAPQVWCLGLPAPTQPVPVAPPPPIIPMPEPRMDPIPIVRPPATSPVVRTWGWRRRRPPVKRPYVPKPKPITPVVVQQAEMCPIRGYVAREIPGAHEYQNFRCTPGQPVVIDVGLQRAGAADAYARHGMLSGLEQLSMASNFLPPPWAILALAAGALYLLTTKRR